MDENELLSWWRNNFDELYASIPIAERKLRTGRRDLGAQRILLARLRAQLDALVASGRMKRSRDERSRPLYAVIP